MIFKSLLVSACTLFAGLFLNSAAQAKTIDQEVRANKTTLIYRYLQYNPYTCGAMAPPKFKVMNVGHGKITGGIRKVSIDKGPCKGRKMKGLSLMYTPNRGYRGDDKASVLLTMPAYTDDSGNSAENLTFRIRVK